MKDDFSAVKCSYDTISSDLADLCASGLMREVYHDDNCIVYNCANSTYAVFLMTKMPSGYSLLTVDHKFVENIVSDPTFLAQIMTSPYYKDYIEKRYTIINPKSPKFINLLEQMNLKYAETPDASIDLAMEERIKKKGMKL